MSFDVHCTRFCRTRGWGKRPDLEIHYHAGAKRKRFVKRRYPRWYKRPVAGEDERRTLNREGKR